MQKTLKRVLKLVPYALYSINVKSNISQAFAILRFFLFHSSYMINSIWKLKHT